MKKANIPTTKYMYEQILNTFVTFEEDKILLSESTIKEFALALYFTFPSNIRIIFIPDDITCTCGSKTHKHSIVEWKMDNEYIFL